MKLLTKARLATLVSRASRDHNLGIDFAALQHKAWPYCTGGYKRSAIERDDHDFTVPVWYVNRTDSSAIFSADRSYISLRCVQESILTPEEAFTYEIAKDIWNRLRAQSTTLAPPAPVNVIPFSKTRPRLTPQRIAELTAAFI